MNNPATNRSAEETCAKKTTNELEPLFDLSIDLLCIASPDGLFKRINLAFLEELGYSEQFLLSKKFIDFVHPDDQEITRVKLRGLEEGGMTANFDNRFCCEDGSYKWLHWVCRLDEETRMLYAVAHVITKTKEIELAYREEKELSQLYLDIAGVMILVIGKDQTVTLINRKGCEILGYTREEVLGKNWFDCFLPKSLGPQVKKIYEGLVAGEITSPARNNNPILTKAGEVRQIAWNNTVIYDAEGAFVSTLSSGEDITEQERAQKALKESTYDLRWAQQIAHLGSFVFDINSPGKDTWSEEAFRIIGRSPRGNPMSYTAYIENCVHPDDRVKIREALICSIEEAIPFDIEHQIVRPNGTVRHVHARAEPITNVTGDVTKLVGTVLDITERKYIENEKEKALEQVKAILDTTVEGIITIGARGIIQSFNQAAEEIFGFKAEEVIGQNVKLLMPTPYHEEHDGYLRNYIRTGHRKIIGIGREVTGQRKDGSLFPMELAVSEIKLGRRRIFTGIVRDISERRKMELEILQISEFERQNIGQELHDGLGSQLTGIGMLAQLLAKQLEKSEHLLAKDVGELAGQIKEADYQARNIARGLVPVAAEPSGLESALRHLSETAERTYGVKCTFRKEGDVLIEDVAVSTHLYRIAQEAFSNGVKHGKATKITIDLRNKNGVVSLKIVDNGIGIPEKLPENRGVGLRTMQHRASVIGAQLAIERGKEKGTVVSCQMHSYNKRNHI